MKDFYLFEKANPMHPDKIADRIAGSIVDMVYKKAREEEYAPIIAVEVLIGHGQCTITGEGNTELYLSDIKDKVQEIAGEEIKTIHADLRGQDRQLAENQSKIFKAGDNGIFKGVVPSPMEVLFTELIAEIYDEFLSDGKGLCKYTVDDDGDNKLEITICQSNAEEGEIKEIVNSWLKIAGPILQVDRLFIDLTINPLGRWTGGLNVDAGATNRKLGSDMGRAITGGGLHGKDLTKADITLNLLTNSIAKRNKKEINLMCSIGDEVIRTMEGYQVEHYQDAMIAAKEYIKILGGFENFSKWGLIRPFNE